jgi:hypothetical protein
MDTTKIYLGDSVYFMFDGYDVILTTENGYGSTNTIVMEPEVIIAFQNALTALSEQIKERL